MADTRDEKIAVQHDVTHEEKVGGEKLTLVDTVHQDEAVKILAYYQGDATWTPEEEKRLTRKIDRKLVPMLCITYALQYYDKAMLSQAVSYSMALHLRCL